jgi:outer membrane lipoprotein-sorting protein
VEWVACAILFVGPATFACATTSPDSSTDEPAAPTFFGLNELSQLLRREVTSTASFNEQQYRRVLKEPIERQGEFHFEPPSLFEKRVLAPVTETYRLDGETLSIALPDRKVRRVSLRNQPLLGGLILGFKAVVSGHLEMLAASFEVQVSGTPEAWQIDLRPTQADVAKYIEAIHVTGKGSEPLRFEILECNGDRTITAIEPR